MRIGAFFGVILLALIAVSPARAGPFADELGRCVTGETTPDERRALIRCMFIVVSNNPLLADLTRVDESTRTESYRAVAGVFNRLMLIACRRQAIAALRNEGPQSIETGFQGLGALAGQDMIETPQGMAAIQDFARYLDMRGLEALGREAGVAAVPRT